jgi:hypothetical protein
MSVMEYIGAAHRNININANIFRHFCIELTINVRGTI